MLLLLLFALAFILCKKDPILDNLIMYVFVGKQSNFFLKIVFDRVTEKLKKESRNCDKKFKIFFIILCWQKVMWGRKTLPLETSNGMFFKSFYWTLWNVRFCPLVLTVRTTIKIIWVSSFFGSDNWDYRTVWSVK